MTNGELYVVPGEHGKIMEIVFVSRKSEGLLTVEKRAKGFEINLVRDYASGEVKTVDFVPMDENENRGCFVEYNFQERRALFSCFGADTSIGNAYAILGGWS